MQQDRDAFDNAPDTQEEARGALATTGRFEINPRWAFGWEGLIQSDQTFARTYELPRYTSVEVDNTVFLRGLDDRSYFDLAVYEFLIQAPPERQLPNFEYFEDEQALVHPVLDYQKIVYAEEFGAQVKVDVNLQSLTRDELSVVEICNVVITDPAIGCPDGQLRDLRTNGIDGHSTRATFEVEAKRNIDEGLGGFGVTALASLRGDYTYVDGFSDPASPAVAEDGTLRALPTLGFEARYPLLVSTPSTNHVIEPIAQLFIRPGINDPTLPNEDAQSLVFDSATLLERDKFSGLDRIETGTRANLGLRYAGQYGALNVDALFGQSYHLAGTNPYERRDDLINVGEDSGLETDLSDYVFGLGISNGGPFRFDGQARFDESDFSSERVGLTATYASPALSASTSYTYIAPQPTYGFPETREEVAAAFNVRLSDYWRAQASATFDIDSSRLVSDSIGFTYADDCFNFTIAFAEVRDRYDALAETNRSVTVPLRFPHARRLRHHDRSHPDRPARLIAPPRERSIGLSPHSGAKASARVLDPGKAMSTKLTGMAAALLVGATLLAPQEAAAGSRIKAVVNKVPITSNDVNRRAAFLKLRRVKGNLKKMALDETDRGAAEDAGGTAPPFYRVRRRGRPGLCELRQGQQDPDKGLRADATRVRRDAARFQVLHSRADELAARRDGPLWPRRARQAEAEIVHRVAPDL